MPVIKCSNGKYRIGRGRCMYKSSSKANRAYKYCKRVGKCKD